MSSGSKLMLLKNSSAPLDAEILQKYSQYARLTRKIISINESVDFLCKSCCSYV